MKFVTLSILQSSTVHCPEYNSIYNSAPPFSAIPSLTISSVENLTGTLSSSPCQMLIKEQLALFWLRS